MARNPTRPSRSWRDELYLEYHRGTYTTQARQKWSARHSETRLRIAEALAAVDTAAYPRARLEGVWRRVLFNEFHDILPGSGIHQVYLDANAQYDSAWAALDTLTGRSFAGLRARMDTRGSPRGAVPVVAFNALTWPRSAIVRVPLGGDTVTFLARDVPALGARVYSVRPPSPALTSRLAAPTVGPTWIENAYLRVEVDTTTGAVTRVLDKRNHRDALAPGGRANVLQVFGDVPREWDAWDIGYTGEQWDVTATSGLERHAGADQARFGLHAALGSSTFRQTLVLGRETPYLDVVNDVDWHETHKLLKVALRLRRESRLSHLRDPLRHHRALRAARGPRRSARSTRCRASGGPTFPIPPTASACSTTASTAGTATATCCACRCCVHRSGRTRWPTGALTISASRSIPHAGDWRAARTERLAAEYNTPLLAAGRAGRTPARWAASRVTPRWTLPPWS